eukprot:1161666-Pelagomonas_calceolata.AAC.7
MPVSCMSAVKANSPRLLRLRHRLLKSLCKTMWVCCYDAPTAYEQLSEDGMSLVLCTQSLCTPSIMQLEDPLAKFVDQTRGIYLPASFVLGTSTYGLKTSLDNFVLQSDVSLSLLSQGRGDPEVYSNAAVSWSPPQPDPP